jgi:predicted dehydrogenase
MLNWLVIGVGDITSKRVIPAILAEPRSHLYGIVTRDLIKGRKFVEHVWRDLEQALTDQTIDVVYVGTPVFLHASQTIAALRAGKHVLCEKPLGMNYTEASAMNRVANEAGKIFGAAYYRRMYPKIQRAKQLLQQGAIGQPVLAELNCHTGIHDLAGPRAWLADPAMSGGGPLFDIASHRIDVCNFWFGKPVRVAAQLSNAVTHSIAVEDNATVLIEYAQGGRGIVDVRWHSSIFRDQCRIIGTEGEINLTSLNGPELVYPGGTEHLPAHANLHFPCIENFVSAVLDGAPLVASGDQAIWTDWVTEQAVLSNAARTDART